MSDLLGQLEAALGGAYRFERELGGGGMSRVFLAHETALGRKVVIKVLPPELSAGLNIDRFRREIQLAASLQHPHIVPLLAAGQASDDLPLLYYTMPLVEGESLRARLIRQHELPIGEAIRLLRDVVDALACAHEHGVVHRDIKPDNVLVSRQHAMVTDFGVAKALESGSGEQRLGGALTSLGVALGTPAYMAPEQAAADPHMDHRADIYATGALAYEMLTGRPPFIGPSPQAILAAQVMQAPPPITELRATVPPALAALVMRCLEKKPADRWQSADELLHQLESMATPSGGTQPMLTPVTRTPDSLATVPSVAPSIQEPIRRYLRPLVFVAIVATVAIAALVGLRQRHTAPAATRSGADSAGKMLAILPFKNLGDPADQYFADGLTEEITSRLATVSGLGVISRTSADQYRNTAKALRQIGQELGAGYVLEGSVRWEKSGGASRVRVTPQLIRVRDDRHLWADRYDASLADVFQVQGDIAERVTDALNVALGDSVHQELGATPTAVSEAYDFYLRGNEYAKRTDPEHQRLAIEMYEKAVALDPKFARAFARLAKLYASAAFAYQGDVATNRALAKSAADSALRLAPDLPEAHVAQGFYRYWGLREFDAALREFAIAQASRPNDSELLMAIGLVKRRQGKWDEAFASLQRAAELDPRSLEYQVEATFAAFVVRDFSAVDRLAGRLVALNPDEPNGYIFQYFAAILGRLDTLEAERALRRGLARADSGKILTVFEPPLERDPALASRLNRISPADFDGDTARYYDWRADLEHRRGHPAWERAAWDSGRTVLEAKVKASPTVGEFHSLLGRAYAGLGRKVDAVQEGRKGLALTPRSADAFDHTLRVWQLALIYVRVGEPDSAMDQIEYLNTIPSYFAVNGYRVWHVWDPLRNNPRFQRFLASHQ
jgi:serine/threonine protein kinase/tetratricopeptide (TPR) repeat protein